MYDMIETMGPIAWLMIICAAGALAVVAERLFYFHRVNINAEEFLRGLSSLLRSGQYNEALHEVRLLPGRWLVWWRLCCPARGCPAPSCAM